MRLPQTRPDPAAPAPIRDHGKPGYARDALQMVPAPRPGLLDRLTWVVVAIYAALAVCLIAGGTSPRVACYTIGHVLELGCAGR